MPNKVDFITPESNGVARTMRKKHLRAMLDPFTLAIAYMDRRGRVFEIVNAEGRIVVIIFLVNTTTDSFQKDSFQNGSFQSDVNYACFELLPDGSVTPITYDMQPMIRYANIKYPIMRFPSTAQPRPDLMQYTLSVQSDDLNVRKPLDLLWPQQIRSYGVMVEFNDAKFAVLGLRNTYRPEDWDIHGKYFFDTEYNYTFYTSMYICSSRHTTQIYNGALIKRLECRHDGSGFFTYWQTENGFQSNYNLPSVSEIYEVLTPDKIFYKGTAVDTYTEDDTRGPNGGGWHDWSGNPYYYGDIKLPLVYGIESSFDWGAQSNHSAPINGGAPGANTAYWYEWRRKDYAKQSNNLFCVASDFDLVTGNFILICEVLSHVSYFFDCDDFYIGSPAELSGGPFFKNGIYGSNNNIAQYVIFYCIDSNLNVMNTVNAEITKLIYGGSITTVGDVSFSADWDGFVWNYHMNYSPNVTVTGMAGRRIQYPSCIIENGYMIYSYNIVEYSGDPNASDTNFDHPDDWTFIKRILGTINMETGVKTETEITDELMENYLNTFEKKAAFAVGMLPPVRIH